MECRLASAFLAVALGVKPALALSDYQTLREVEPLVLAKYGACGTEQLEQAVADSLHEESYSHAEVGGAERMVWHQSGFMTVLLFAPVSWPLVSCETRQSSWTGNDGFLLEASCSHTEMGGCDD